MIAVIQCAATKRADAGCYRDSQNRPILFVTAPSKAPPSDRCVYARPDDDAEGNATWRDLLVQYNQTPGNNPFGLLPAIDLYENDTYRQLAAKVGRSNTYILSAGWGLISADFLTPAYDITFSAAADAHSMADKMSEAFLAFARSGDPNGRGLPKWEPYELCRRQTMIFDDPARLVDDPRGGERRLFAKVPFLQQGT